MTQADPIEISIVKKYKKNIWHRFIKAGKEYSLICDGDRIACVLENDVQSLLLAKCFERLKKYSETQFELEFISEHDISGSFGLEIVKTGDIYEYAKERGFNKLAVCDCFDDCTEHILTCQLYEGRLSALTPKEQRGEVTLIRTMLLIRRGDIAAFARCNGLALPLSSRQDDERTLKVRRIISELAPDNKNLEINILRSCEEVNLETVISYIENGQRKSALFN